MGRHANSLLLLVVLAACSSSLWLRPATCTEQDLPSAFDGLGLDDEGKVGPGAGAVPGPLRSPDPVEVNRAKALAQALHSEIYTDRVANLKDRIKKISDDSLDNIKNSLQQKFGSEASKYTETRLEKIRKLPPQEMRQELLNKVDGLKAYDTIAVMSSKEGNYLAIAGNIMSPDIPDVYDTNLWGDVLKVMKKQLYEWKRKDFGLQDTDHPAILRVLKSQSSEDVKWTDRDVYVVDKVEPPERKLEEEEGNWRKM